MTTKTFREAGEKFLECRSRVGQRVALQAIALVLWSCAALAQETVAGPQLRVLAIYSGSSTLAANVSIESGIASVFSQAEKHSRYEIYGEYRDVQRFPGTLAEQRFVDALVTKYADQTIDALMTVGPEALPLAIEFRTRVAPEAPIVFGGVQAATQTQYSGVAGLYGVLSSVDLRGTFDLARQLQPDANRTVIFTGSAAFDERWKSFAEDVMSVVHDIEVEFVSGLSLQEFRDRAAMLGLSDILIILTIFEDADGRRFVPADAVAKIAEVSGAPTYGVYSSNIGRGVVGGSYSSFESTGMVMAEQALKVLDNQSHVETSVTVPVAAVLDWRQLKRYGIDAEMRPPDSQLLYYDPVPWERYRLQIALALAVIALQSSTIAALIVMDRRRRRAAEELGRRRMEMARLSRIAQLGELSGAIAHELNQPLTSILANAEAGSAMLAQDPPDIAEVGEALRDIAEDDRRAADIITNLRGLMANGGCGVEPADLNEMVRSTMRLVSSELLARGVTVRQRLSGDPLVVMADVRQLQQVLLNLVINAADAMADETTRKLTVTTERGDGDQRVLSVTDTGPGLPEELRDNPFKPFATSKAQGMGLGLSISQSIAETHGGTLRFARSTSEGARVELALPAP